jgi:hypothetical protein
MQVKQIIFKTGEQLFPDAARQRVASALDQIQPGLVALLMNYEPGSEKTKSEFPAVQFGRAKGGFALLGFGQMGATLVDDAAPFIVRGLSKQGSGIINVHHREVELSIERRPYQFQYRVGSMVVQKRREHRAYMADQVKGKAHLEALFLRSLQRQADAVGMSLPEGLEIEFLGAERVTTAKGKGYDPMALKGAVFGVNARLGGIWSVGYMLSKGYGQFDATYQLGLGVTQ